MILWAGRATPEPPREMGDRDRRLWRWVIETERWRGGIGIALARQVRVNEGEWRLGAEYYEVTLTRSFGLGERHDYYDWPNCGFSLGWLHINWSAGWCTKCMPDA